jgi:hypothetical protein
VIAPGCSELQLPAVKPAGKSRFTTFWGAIIMYNDKQLVTFQHIKDTVQ